MSWVKLFQPLSTECQGSKIISNRIKQSLGVCVSNYWILWSIEVEHIMTTVHVFINISLTSASEGLNCILFPLLHSFGITIFYNWHTLTSMNSIALNTVPTKISNTLNRVCFVSNLNFVRLHRFLNLLSDISQTNINPGCFNTSVSSIFYSG